jgi:membrane protease subunit HflC
MANKRIGIHWPVLLLGVVVAAIFFVVLFVFQVHETEYAVVQRLGSPRRHLVDGEEKVRVYAPGLHWKVPFIDWVWRHDNRLLVYDLKRGQVEQMQTVDDYQVILTTFVLWRVGDPYTYMQAIKTTENAEKKLDELVRSSRSNVVGRHRLDEFINVDESAVRIAEVEQEILDGVVDIAMREYGIEVRRIGLKHLGFPEDVTEKVFDRMRTERERRAKTYREEGRLEAQKIRAEAEEKATGILTEARTEATRIRAEGDQAAAEFYAVFQKNPELAMFLRKLSALRETISDKTTLVLGTRTPPYDLLLPGALDLRIMTEPLPNQGGQE